LSRFAKTRRLLDRVHARPGELSRAENQEMKGTSSND
jgi:hypothetical protein